MDPHIPLWFWLGVLNGVTLWSSLNSCCKLHFPCSSPGYVTPPIELSGKPTSVLGIVTKKLIPFKNKYFTEFFFRGKAKSTNSIHSVAAEWLLQIHGVTGYQVDKGMCCRNEVAEMHCCLPQSCSLMWRQFSSATVLVSFPCPFMPTHHATTCALLAQAASRLLSQTAEKWLCKKVGYLSSK